MISLRRIAIVFLSFFLLPLTAVVASPQHGADGTKDSPNGGAGTDLSSTRYTVGDPYYWRVQGFNGGHGWEFAGYGGRGGNVGAIWTPLLSAGVSGPVYQRSVYVEAVAGNGGDGRSTAPGGGGHGGSAHSVASGGFFVTSRAVGGNGGAARGPWSFAGHGGNASTTVSLINPQHYSATWQPQIWTMAIGGRGGDALEKAYAGDGGHSILTGPISVQHYGPNFSGARLEMIGRGGNGGNSSGNKGGTGGNSTADLHAILSLNRHGFNQPRAISTASLSIFGGRGGDGLAHRLANSPAGAGGNASIEYPTLAPAGVTNLNIVARGGRGGDSYGEVGGHGGLGGLATVGPIRFFSGVVNMHVRGGDGGHSQAGNGGDGRTILLGGPVALTNPSGNFQFKIVAQGGDGGDLWGSNTSWQGSNRRAGSGGQGIVFSTNQISNLFGSDNFVRAIGGWAGRGIGAEGSERAGDAIVRIRENISNTGSLSAIAEAGRSFQRTNGEAIATIDLRVNEGVFGDVTASAIARPDPGEQRTSPIPLANFGGSAHAESSAYRDSVQGLVHANANAESGFGILQSGASTAIATAINASNDNTQYSVPYQRGKDAVATASALSRADGTASSLNHAISRAKAVSNVFGEATASSRALGQYNFSRATAEAHAPKGIATAKAEGETTQWIHRSNVSANAFSHSSANQPLVMVASAFTAFRHSQFDFRENGFDEFAPTAWNHLLINPGQLAVDNFTNSNSFIDQQFDFGSRSTQVGNILAIGMTGGGRSLTKPVDGDFQAINQFDLTLHLHPTVQGSDELSLAFFNPVAFGSGFESLAVKFDYQGINILDEQFTDLATAKAFFTNRIISLDGLVDAEGLERQFSLKYDMKFARTGDVFGFDFLIGSRNQTASFSTFSAVPEPATVPVMLGLAMAMVLRRRRVAKHNHKTF